MSVNTGSIVYTVDVETANLVGDTKTINRELDKLDKSLDKTDSSARKASGGIDKFSKTTKSAQSGAEGFTSKLTPLAAAIGGLITIQTLVNMQRMAEQFTILSARIARLSTDAAEAGKTYRALLDISSQTGANIANTVGLWESLTGTLREMGRTNSDVLRLTETLQKIGTLGGSSAEDMSNALRQLGQGLAGGVIRAEEFNSVLEGMPELARQIAQGLGIPFSELRQRMLDGQLTAEDVLSSIENRTQKVNEEFKKIPRTVSQASNSIINEMGAAIAVIDKASGASGLLAKALDAIAKGIRFTAGNLTDQEKFNELFAERQKIVESLAKSEGTWRENMPGAIALREKLKKLDTELLELQDRRIAEQKKEGAQAKAEPKKAEKTEEAKKTTSAKRVISDEERQERAIRSRIDALEIQADALGMTTSELEIYKLQLAGATDEQIRAAQSSLSLVDAYKMQADAEAEIQKRRESFGDTSTEVTATVTGQVSPLSGGMFDDQTARYEAEAEAERVRYEEQLLRLQEAKTLQLEVVGGYQALEQDMAQQHADRLAQIEQAKNQTLLASGQQLFDGLASATATFAGEQSSAYKAMFAISKGFAIAQASLQLSAALTQVLGDPSALTPAQKFANVAAVAAAGSSLVSAVGSATYSGRAQGGPVQSDGMYRVNETGAPEIFNAANGRQYMMPNQRGQVVSNADAKGGAGITNVITISVGESGASVDSGSSQTESVALAQSIRTVVVDELERQNRQGGILWSMRNNG